MEYTLNIQPFLPAHEQALVGKYWLLDSNDQFVHKPGALAAEHKMTIKELIGFIGERSHYLVADGPCPYCGKERITTLSTQAEYRAVRKKHKLYCQPCQQAALGEVLRQGREQQNDSNQKAHSNMPQPAPEDLVLKALSQTEAYLLRLIVAHRVHTPADIIQHLFQGNPSNKPGYWAALYRLGEKKIIHLSLNYRKYIQSIHYSEQLAWRLAQLDSQSHFLRTQATPVKEISALFSLEPIMPEGHVERYNGSTTIEYTTTLNKGDIIRYQAYEANEGHLFLNMQVMRKV